MNTWKFRILATVVVLAILAAAAFIIGDRSDQPQVGVGAPAGGNPGDDQFNIKVP